MRHRYPPFAFYRAIYLMFVACQELRCLQWSDVTPDSEIAHVFAFLAVETVIMLILAL
jgi:hypothetical protein